MIRLCNDWKAAKDLKVGDLRQWLKDHAHVREEELKVGGKWLTKPLLKDMLKNHLLQKKEAVEQSIANMISSFRVKIPPTDVLLAQPSIPTMTMATAATEITSALLPMDVDENPIIPA